MLVLVYPMTHILNQWRRLRLHLRQRGLLKWHPELFRGGHVVKIGRNEHSAALLKRIVEPGFRAFQLNQEPPQSVDRLIAVQGSGLPLSLIWIEEEGREMEICRGAEFTLAGNPHCGVLLHYHRQAPESAAELVRWFERRGYRAEIVTWNGRLSPHVDLRRNGPLALLFRRTR